MSASTVPSSVSVDFTEEDNKSRQVIILYQNQNYSWSDDGSVEENLSIAGSNRGIKRSACSLSSTNSEQSKRPRLDKDNSETNKEIPRTDTENEESEDPGTGFTAQATFKICKFFKDIQKFAKRRR